MKASVTLKENRDFQRLYRRGKSAGSATLVLYWRGNHLGTNRLGITTGAKLGNAVTRNKMRRRVREIYRHHSGELRRGIDLVVVVRHQATERDYWKLDRDFCRCAQKLGIWKPEDRA